MNRRIGLAFVLMLLLIFTGCTTKDSSTANKHGTLSELWVSDTARDIGGNHHAPAAGHVMGQPLVFAPISGKGGTTQCALVALNGRDGTLLWSYQVPPMNCTIHSVADPTVADVDQDKTAEVIAATTERTVAVYGARSGNISFRHNLSSYGYTKPLVANVSGDRQSELIVVDVKGSVFVIRANGSTVWNRRYDTYTWGQPAVTDFDADGSPELVTALSSGDLTLYTGQNGSVEWEKSLSKVGSVTWQTNGQADGDKAVEIALASDSGKVLLYDGQRGNQQWRKDFGEFAAVNALGDGDGDGRSEVYVVAKDGELRSVDVSTGRVEWTTTLAAGDSQMVPPPSLGDVNGDGKPEVIAPTNGGQVIVVNPKAGEILASYQRRGSIWTHPTLANLDDDSASEILIMYGNGEVVALEFGSQNSPKTAN